MREKKQFNRRSVTSRKLLEDNERKMPWRRKPSCRLRNRELKFKSTRKCFNKRPLP